MNAKEYEFLVGKHDVSEHRLNSSVEYRRTKREILLIFALFILISWCFSLNDIPSFLLKFFPWGH